MHYLLQDPSFFVFFFFFSHKKGQQKQRHKDERLKVESKMKLRKALGF